MIWKNMASQVYEMVLTYNVVAAGILDEVMAVLSSTDWDTKSIEKSSHLTHLTYHTLFHVVFQEEHYKLLSDEGEQKKSYLRLREMQSFYSRNEEEISGQHTELPIGE
ncbi:hypothetical protein MJG53_015918 [Ovis ammon polii x Ovis aries]|uniref:Uncharacterized protein n=1 Tax=Ovis ammon polii x Ovis aries TaxID=2918886 RepID=A0ACB9UC49_9CETA|nr:hypothetical protein MJG53_015918 [Ovis ammon polii x Ovis aries]